MGNSEILGICSFHQKLINRGNVLKSVSDDAIFIFNILIPSHKLSGIFINLLESLYT